MAYFEWGPDMNIDQGGPIDQDHQLLVDQVNTLHTATSEGRGQEIVGELLDALIEDTIEHIRREEQYMERQGFPDLEAHRSGHERFVAQLRELQDKYTAGGITVAAQLSRVLRDWLSLHIRRHDKAIYFFLQEQQRKAHQQRLQERTAARTRPQALLTAP